MLSSRELIDLLVNADIESFFDRDDAVDYLAYLFERGFKGYENYEHEELLEECIDRNLIEEYEKSLNETPHEFNTEGKFTIEA
jgi:hypothetical protein